MLYKSNYRNITYLCRQLRHLYNIKSVMLLKTNRHGNLYIRKCNLCCYFFFYLSMNFVLFWLFIVRYSGIRFELEYKQKSRWTLNSFWVPSIYLGITVLTIQNFTIIESLHCDLELTNDNKEILVKMIYKQLSFMSLYWTLTPSPPIWIELQY